MHTTYLALGTNIGEKQLNLLIAIARIAERIGILLAISSVYETEPWGFESENSFLNMVVKVKTDLSPFNLLQVIQTIEMQMGRRRINYTRESIDNLFIQHYQDRIIDIDIIFYDDLVCNSGNLIIPHPFYKQRDFVMKPLREIMSFDFC